MALHVISKHCIHKKKTKKEKAILINTVRRKCAVKNTQKCHIRIIYCVSMCGQDKLNNAHGVSSKCCNTTKLSERTTQVGVVINVICTQNISFTFTFAFVAHCRRRHGKFSANTKITIIKVCAIRYRMNRTCTCVAVSTAQFHNFICANIENEARSHFFSHLLLFSPQLYFVLPFLTKFMFRYVEQRKLVRTQLHIGTIYFLALCFGSFLLSVA